MPRRAKLDFPNLLHQVMARGIEGGEIFRDTKDREEFLRRLSKNLTSGKARLYAWVLMSTHFHLLLRPEVMPLSTIMRPLLTSYAVWHIRRHSRKGHLRAHEEAGQSFAVLGRRCGFSHTSVREAIAKARMEE